MLQLRLMTYHHQKGVVKEKKNKKWLFILPSLFLIGGVYMLLNAFAPAAPILDSRPPDATAQKLVKDKPGSDGNRLYIPQINVDVAIVQGDSELALERGAWHRNPHNGDPVNGGNFVLSAHRFLLGVTPSETRAKSPFYHIDKLKLDDELYVDYGGKRYVYKVNKKYQVPADATQIEAPSEEDKLTLYSCNLRGPEAGREVIEAKPIGTVAWNGSRSFISPSNVED